MSGAAPTRLEAQDIGVDTVHPPLRYIVITPVRDEVAHVALTIRSMAQQTVRPDRWVIVDDGSTDGTGELIDRLVGPYPWISAIHRHDRGFRASGGGVVDAFYAGFESLESGPGISSQSSTAISLSSPITSRCLQRFSEEPQLGIAGGVVCARVNGELRIDSSGDPPFHVRGATKIYRRACWDQIAPLIRAPGWDTLDEVKANFLGWRTYTFADLQVVQHKPTGDADGKWANAFKNGRANYFTGYHPFFMLGKVIRRARRRPAGVESAGMLAGFVSAYWRRLPRLADPATIDYLRRQQIKRIFSKPSIYG